MLYGAGFKYNREETVAYEGLVDEKFIKIRDMLASLLAVLNETDGGGGGWLPNAGQGEVF